MSKSEPHVRLFYAHLEFSNKIRHWSCTDCQQMLLAAFRLFRAVLRHLHACPTLFSAWTCVCFVNSELFLTFNKLLFKGQISLK